jgi:Fe-Mn family superoxide dismutase
MSRSPLVEETNVPFEVPALTYDYDALEPSIDEATMKLHHDKHHQAYVTNLNAAIEKHPELANKSPEDLIKDIPSLPEDIRKAVQNNGGGHVNHTMFWEIMGPKAGGAPSGSIPSRNSLTSRPPSSSAPAGAGWCTRAASWKS